MAGRFVCLMPSESQALGISRVGRVVSVLAGSWWSAVAVDVRCGGRCLILQDDVAGQFVSMLFAHDTETKGMAREHTVHG
jgi:hypothetical protein